MRLRLPVRRAVLFGTMFVVALVLTLPMRVLLGAAATGLAAREVTGSIWTGRLLDARAGPALLGDLRAGIAPLSLLAARARIGVAREGTGAPFAATLSVGGARRAVEGLTGTVPVAGALPLAGIAFTDVDATFRDGRCQRAAGTVQAMIAPGVADGQPLAQGLSGGARCDRGALLVPLASASGAQTIDLRVTGDGTWQAEARLGGAQ
jgi:general secretion pathway protein N